MADTKVINFPPSAGLVLTDIFPVIDDPGGAPDDQKATFAQLQTLLSSGPGAFVNESGDTMTGALAIGNGVQVASAPVLSLSQTWNNAAVTFTNFLSNVTNTASNSNSNLFNYQVDGVDRFNFTVGGVFRAIRQTADDSGLSVFLRKRGTTGDINGAVANNSVIYSISSSGWDGAAFQTGAQIISSVEGAWTGANRGNQLFFTAVPTGTITALTALTVSGADVILGVSLRTPYVAKVATYTATSLDFTIDCTGTFTIDLPTAVGIVGRIYIIKNSGVGTITIDPSGAQLIDGLATSPVISGAAAMIQSNNVGWIII